MASREEIEAAVIRPMLAEFPGPGNLRTDPEAREARLDRYRRALARFDRQTLVQGFQLAVERTEIFCWPAIRDLVEACSEVARRQRRPEDPWVERATALTDQYTRRFMKTSAVAAKAREGGFEAELRQYVEAASWVQSQFICGRNGCGYDHRALFGPGPRAREAEDEFFRKAREQATTGEIKVRVPPTMIKRWSAEAEQGRGR